MDMFIEGAHIILRERARLSIMCDGLGQPMQRWVSRACGVGRDSERRAAPTRICQCHTQLKGSKPYNRWAGTCLLSYLFGSSGGISHSEAAWCLCKTSLKGTCEA